MSRGRLREASWWLARLEGGRLSTRERARFEAWRKDPANRDAFESAERTLERLRQQGSSLRHLIDAETPVRSSWRMSFVNAGLSAGLALVAAIAMVGVWLYAPQTYVTAVGEYREVRLADGSAISLNTDTAVEVSMRHDRRDIQLARGEAFFRVAADRRRPFIVQSDKGRVEVQGGAFIVRVHEDGLEVIVREGRVAIADPGEAARQAERQTGRQAPRRQLGGGERYERRGARVSVAALSAHDIERALAWREGMLWFEGETLSEVLDEVARHSGVSFVLSEPELGDVAITAYMRAGNVEAFAARLEETYPELVLRRAGDVIHIERRAGD